MTSMIELTKQDWRRCFFFPTSHCSFPVRSRCRLNVTKSAHTSARVACVYARHAWAADVVDCC